MADENIDRLLDDIARAVGPAIEADPLQHLEGGFTTELERIRGWLKARTAYHGAPGGSLSCQNSIERPQGSTPG